MAGERVLLIGHDGGVAHAFEEIVILIVMAHVRETETPVVLFRATAFRRAMAGLLGATRHWHFGPSVFTRRSLSGLTRTLSNRGESNFMTGYYALFAVTRSRLDNQRFVLDFAAKRLKATKKEPKQAEASIDPQARLLKPGSMRTADLITQKLTEAFAPQSLEVVDESHQHEGHAGHRPGGQTHFRINIVSDSFKGRPGWSATA